MGISTRNNNFSNRAHTLKIIVAEGRSREEEIRAQKEAGNAAIAGGVAGFFVAIILLGLAAVGIWMVFFRGRDSGGESQRAAGNATTITHKATNVPKPPPKSVPKPPPKSMKPNTKA